MSGRLRRLWLLTPWVVLLLTLGIAMDVAYAFITLPAIPPGGFDPSRPSLVMAMDGKPVGPLSGDVFRIPASLNEMPPYLPEAFVASEDARFREHIGVDPRGVARAMLTNLRSGSISEGGSTITQQVVKNTFLTSHRTLRRKLQEVVMAVALERRYAKDEILTLYLNQIYLGHGAYGVGAAAELYFNKTVADLTLGEAATLVGITPAPETYSPLRHPARAEEMRNLVLDRMVAVEVIDAARAAAEKAQPLTTHQGKADLKNPSPWYMDVVREELRERYGLDDRAVELMGLTIHTGLDRPLQLAAEKALALKRFPASAPDGLEGAFVALDPRTGQVRALVGGREYAVKAGFNRAAHGQVPPGSVLKPIIVYAPAFEHAGLTPDSIVADSPLSVNGWEPQNWDGKFRGDVTVREAARLSLNLPTIRMMQQVGVAKARAFAQNLGIPFAKEDQSLTLALGGMARGLSPLQLAGAYQPFANGGTYHEPHLITSVEAAGGRLAPRPVKSRRGMRSQTAHLVTDILKTVVQSGTGTGGLLPRPMAGKTGTVELPGTAEFQGLEGNAAAWFVGYTPDLVGTVWLGYDQIDHAHYLPATVNGSTYPTAIWREIVGAALSGRPALAFPGPDGRIPPPPPTKPPAQPVPPKPPAEPETVALPPIRDLQSRPGDRPGSVALTWQVDLDEPLPETVGFVVYRGATPDFPADTESEVTVVAIPSFMDIPDSPGTYYYRVAATDLVTREPGPVSQSVEVIITVDEDPPEDEEPPQEQEPPQEPEPPEEQDPPVQPLPPILPLPPGILPPPPTKP